MALGAVQQKPQGKAALPFEHPFHHPLDAKFPAAALLSDDGWNKQVFEVKGRGDVVLRVLRERVRDDKEKRGPWDPKRVADFNKERTGLKTLEREYGIPAMEIIEAGTYQGRPADVVRRYDLFLVARWWDDANERKKLDRMAERLFGTMPNNDYALRTLKNMQRAFQSGLVVNDFQLALRPGRIGLADIGEFVRDPAAKKEKDPFWRDCAREQEALVNGLLEAVRRVRRKLEAQQKPRDVYVQGSSSLSFARAV
jgi:hypothetical protein